MKTIAVIEDNPDNRLLVSAILEDDFEIIEYETGPEALEGMKIETPDLILLDISLPEMDGVEVLSHIRNDEKLKNIPVIALTAHAMAGDREKYLSKGFDEYITKPIVDESLLMNAIQQRMPE
ncbi:response regulator [bacterium]|nr:response regulator [bacterium]